MESHGWPSGSGIKLHHWLPRFGSAFRGRLKESVMELHSWVIGSGVVLHG